MQRLAMDLRMLSRELSLYLEHQVRIGFFGSGVGLSLILGFSFAYACYYMSSIAKVSRRMARAQGRGQLSGSDSSRLSMQLSFATGSERAAGGTGRLLLRVTSMGWRPLPGPVSEDTGQPRAVTVLPHSTGPH